VFFLGNGFGPFAIVVGQCLHGHSCLQAIKRRCSAEFSSCYVAQIVIPHPVFCSPNRLLQLSLGLGSCWRSAPTLLLFSQLAPSLLDFAIPPPSGHSTDPYFLGRCIEYLAQCFLEPLSFTIVTIACTLHSQVCPSHCTLSPEALSMLLNIL